MDPTIRSQRLRRAAIGLVLAVLLLAGAGYWRSARQFEVTDDAQIDANLSAISPRIAGTVVAVHISDNQVVSAGAALVELDSNDFAVARSQALAQVALAEAQLSGTESELSESRTDSALAERQRARWQQLAAAQVVGEDAYDQRASRSEAASAALNAARHQVSVRRASLDIARAQLQQADLNLGYAHLVAPIAGIVGRKSVNVGDRVEPGQTLLFISQQQDMWITAYYRETQIRRMRVGASAMVHIDATARDYHGSVESIGGATGSRYSLLPPENASGNYVKVVQRLAVRIRLDPGQPGMDRLRAGMSAEPRVHVQ